MTQLRYTAIGVAAALACHASFAQNTLPDTAAEATLPSINIRASNNVPDWQTLRNQESRVRAIGAEMKTTTLDTNSAQHATVIDADELNRINALNTLDILERVPGVTVNRTGGLDGTIFMRGQDSNSFRVPMFINGDRFRGRPAFQFMMISPAELEQVEVIRGPASVRYGSDGLSGLVNFVSKKPKGTLGEEFTFQGGEADLTYRSNGDSLQANLSLEAAGNQFDLRVYGSGRHANKYDTPAGNVLNSEYTSGSGGITLGYMPNANERYELSYRYGEIRDGTSNYATKPTNLVRRDPLSIHQLRLGYEGTFNDSWVKRVNASLYGNAFESMLDTASIAGDVHKMSTNQIQGPNVIGGNIAFELPTTASGIDTSFGFEFAHDHWLGTKNRTTTYNSTTGASTDTGFIRNGREMTQSNVGAFVLNEWAITPRWKLTGGARYDYYLTDTEVAFYGANLAKQEELRPALEAARNTTTGALTGSIGTSYFVTDEVELTGSYGTGFHMPWHSDMFNAGWNADSGKYSLPNPNLKPEYSTTAELGMRWHLPTAYVDVSAYQSMYRDYLQTVNTSYEGTPATQTQNVGKARIQGFEAAGKWQIDQQWNLHGSLAYVRGTNRLINTPIKGLSPLTGSVGAQYVGAGDIWAVTGEVQFAKGQSRYDAKSEHPAGGYGIVNLYSQLQLDKLGFGSKNTQLSIGITNLFDKQYRSASTSSDVAYVLDTLNPLLSPGRSINVTLRTKF